MNFFMLNKKTSMNKIDFVEPFGVHRELHRTIEN